MTKQAQRSNQTKEQVVSNPAVGPDPDDRGIAAVWMALMISVFLGFAAMTVDLGLWYIAESEAQSAADASALAGATLLPNDPDLAIEEAERVAGQYGYSGAAVNAVVLGNSQLKVEISTTVENVFLPAIGFANTQAVGSSATAEYEGAVAMGSPDNVLGNDPTTGGVQPDMTLGIAGPNQYKKNGDRFSTNRCGNGSGPGDAVDQCASFNGPNQEFDPNGYAYTVTVSDLSNNEDLVIEVFDAAWSGNNSTSCSSDLPSSSQLNALIDLTDDSDYVNGSDVIPQGWFDDAADRYRTGPTLADGSTNYWCTGDNQNGGTDGMVTSYIFRAPDDTPWNPWDNPVIDVPGECEAVGVGPWDYDTGSINNAMDYLDPGAGESEWAVDETDGNWTFNELFHRWAPLCRIDSADVKLGEYIVQVRTSANASDPLTFDPAHIPQGQNFFMMRTGFDTGSGLSPYAGDVALSARGRMPVNANLPASNQTFYLAKIFPSDRARTLVVEFFDVGDASVPGQITIVPPVESGLSSFTGCSFTWNIPLTLYSVADECRIFNAQGNLGYNGRTVLAQVPIPDDTVYNCDVVNGCWVTILVQFPEALTDFATWSSYITGDPVRLIE